MVPGSTSRSGRRMTRPAPCECAATTTAPFSSRRHRSWRPLSSLRSYLPVESTASCVPYVPRSSVRRSEGARPPGCSSTRTTVPTRSSSATLAQREHRAGPEQDETEHARPADRDAVEAEPAEAVDQRRDAEVERDDRPDRGRKTDARRRDRDREDDQHRKRPAGPQPQGLARHVAETAEALLDEQEQDGAERKGDDAGEGERGEDPRALA